MKKFTQRVLLLGIAEIAIVGAVGGVDLVGVAQAVPATCLTATGPCQPEQTPGRHTQVAIVCGPAGPKAGVGCHQLAGHPA